MIRKWLAHFALWRSEQLERASSRWFNWHMRLKRRND